MAEQDTAVPATAPVIFDPPIIYMHRDARVPPLPVYTQAQADALPPEWMAPDVWMAGGGGGGGGGAQTPWTSDIDAAGHSLSNATNVRTQYLYLPANGGIALGSFWIWYDTGNSAITITGDIDVSGHRLANVASISPPPDTGSIEILGNYISFTTPGAPIILQLVPGAGRVYLQVPQFANVAAAQAVLGVGSGGVWRDMNNALFVA